MFEGIIEKFKKAEHIGIFTHINPDGDAMGSAYSLKAAAEQMGKSADVFYCGETEKCLLDLVKGASASCEEMSGCDFLIALDCAASDRLGKWSEVFLKHKNTAAIDHHKTHIEFAGETVVGDVSSTCELMYDFYRELGIELSHLLTTNLYIGMATDTGNFKFSSVTGKTHRIAADLIDAGVDFAKISKRLFDTVSKEYLDIEMRAIKGMKYYLENRVAILRLEKQDFIDSGITETEASALVSLPVSIESVEVGVYIRPRTDEGYKVSLRSVNIVDVSQIAASFGGGGHIRAAAYTVDFDKIDEGIACLVDKISEQM